MTEMNVGTIVREWLIDRGYDGLVSDRCECGCSVDDLMPCGFDCIESCLPAYRYLHDGKEHYGTNPHDEVKQLQLSDATESSPEGPVSRCTPV